jgi:acyl-CoA dehydrogenase
MTAELQALFAESAHELFSSEVDENTLRAAEGGTWPSALWKHVEESGYTTLFDDDELGATWNEAYPIIAAASEALAPIPLAETLIAGWLLRQAGIEQPPGPLTIVPDASDVARMQGVPWGRAAEHAVAIIPGTLESSVVLYRIAHLRVTPGKNAADEPRDTLDAAAAGPVKSAALPGNLPADVVQRFGALVRAVQMAGAVNRILEQSVRFAKEREQFGKQIGSYQAISHQLAILTEEKIAAEVASAYAWRELASDAKSNAAGVAKIRAGRAAGIATTIGHAVHAAIGMTREHTLHFATRRLWSWRAEFGSESHWARKLGEDVVARGGANFWSDIT